MKNLRNKIVRVEYDRLLIGSFEVDNDLKIIPNKDVTWYKDTGEIQLKNTKNIKFKDYEISYFFVYLNLEDEIPDEVQEVVYVHSQAVIKIDEDEECYYDPHQKNFFYSAINGPIESENFEEILETIANKLVAIRTIKF